MASSDSSFVSLQSHGVASFLLAQAAIGIALHKIVLDAEGRPVDYITVDANEAFEKMTGRPRAAVVGKLITEVSPGIRDEAFDWIDFYGRVALGGPERTIERHYAPLGRWFRIQVVSPEPLHFAAIFTDISEQKKTEEARRIQASHLAERVKEMRLLIKVSEIARDWKSPLPELLAKVAALVPEAFQWPESTGARIRFRGEEFASAGFRVSPFMIAEVIRVFGEMAGVIEVSMPEGPPAIADSAFLPEEENLLRTLSRLLSNFAERAESDAARLESDAARLESEAKFRQYVEYAPDAIFVADENGDYIDANPAACRLLGYSREELLAKNVMELLAPESREVGARNFATLTAEGESSDELQLLSKDGSPIWVSLYGVAIPGLRLVAFCRDISARKKAESTHELYFHALDALDQALIITNSEGTIIETNRAFLALYGYKREDVVGRNPRILNPGPRVYADLGHSAEDVQKLFGGLWSAARDPGRGHWQGVVINRRKDGGLVWVNLHVSSVFDEGGRVRNMIGLPIDISESRHRDLQGKIELYSTIAQVAALRDNETGNHMRRVGIWAKLLAKSIGQPARYCEDLESFAPMHDLGKVGILDSILLAERKLTPEEWAEMQKHTVLGFNIVKGKQELEMAAAITLSHHERWDGTGYPRGLAGEAIPLSARLTTVADVYDALRSKRSYKEAWSHEEALAEIQAQAGRQFDPKIVAIFVGLAPRFAAVFEELQ